MSIKKSQAIVKCFIDLESRVWFTLGSEDETMFCDTELSSARLPVSQRIWTPNPNPLADMDPPSQIWNLLLSILCIIFGN